MPEKRTEKTGKEGRRAAHPAVSLGTNMAGAFVLFGLLGYYQDYKRGGGYAWTLGGLLLASACCVYEVWKLVRRLDAEEKQRKHEER